MRVEYLSTPLPSELMRHNSCDTSDANKEVNNGDYFCEDHRGLATNTSQRFNLVWMKCVALNRNAAEKN